jgi:hypothetical protein
MLKPCFQRFNLDLMLFTSVSSFNLKFYVFTLLSCSQPHFHVVDVSNIVNPNLKSKVLTTRKGSKLVGYGPMLPMTDKSFAPFLASVGITGTSRQNDACKILRRKLEQDYLRDVIRPVKDLESVDPIVVQIGYGLHAIIRKVVFKIVRYLCKIVHVSNVKI